MRCSSNNHSGDQCECFEYWAGPASKYCGYLHKSTLSPRFNKDKKSENRGHKKVNTTELQEDIIGYIPAVAQPMNNEYGLVDAPGGMFPNLYIPGGSKN